MYVKKIRRKCGVRGCKNIESYAISKGREMGNSIIACKECIMEALAVIEEQNKPVTIEEDPVIENNPIKETPTEAVSEEKPKTARQRKK